ncbi:MAG: hypothetical protein RRB13_16130 [bacterium]|nr:hypothetical protein [bacterium]
MIRWVKDQESVLDEAGDVKEKKPLVELFLTNNAAQPVYVNALVYRENGEPKPLALTRNHGYKTKYGLPFRIEAYETVRARPQYKESLLQALAQGEALQVFLAHWGWPKPIRPIASQWIGGALIDADALAELKST